MSKEKLFSELNRIFDIDESYNIANFFKNNIGASLTALSLFAAFLVFGAKVIGYLIAIVHYQYWNLSEDFLTEDDKVYLRLGVYILYIVLTMAANAIAKKYAYIWELYNCQIYVFSKVVKLQGKTLKMSKKEHRVIKNGFDVVVKVDKALKDQEDYPGGDDQINYLKLGIEEMEERIKLEQDRYRDSKLHIFRWKVGHVGYLVVSLVVVVIASFILQATTGLNTSGLGGVGVIQSTMMLSVIIMAGVLLDSWTGIKLRFIMLTNSFFKNDDLILNSEFTAQLLRLLEDKVEKIRYLSVKQYFSDKVCKNIALYILYFSVIAMAFMPIKARYNLEHLDSFYVVHEEKQDYVVVVNSGSKYILAECNIMGTAVKIDANNICISHEPIKMEKVKFKKVDK